MKAFQELSKQVAARQRIVTRKTLDNLDIEDFMVMERDDQIEVFRTLISNLRENDSKVDESMSQLREKISDLENELSIARNSHPLLSDMEKELVRVKLALADKDIKLFELTVGASSRVKSHVPSPSAQLNNVNQSSSIASGPLASD
jgi:predicted nuclease with TOPRIM domain